MRIVFSAFAGLNMVRLQFNALIQSATIGIAVVPVMQITVVFVAKMCVTLVGQIITGMVAVHTETIANTITAAIGMIYLIYHFL